MSMESEEAQIRQLVSDWSAATQRGDVQAVLKLMTEDVVFLMAGQPPMRGKAAFAAAMNAMRPGEAASTHAMRPHIEIAQEIKEITVVNDSAYMWSALKVTVRPQSAPGPMTRAGHTLTVLRKIEGQWLIARDANMLVTQAA